MAPIRRYFEFVCLPCSRHIFHEKKTRTILFRKTFRGSYTNFTRNDEELIKRVCKAIDNPREDLSVRLKDAIYHWYLSDDIPDFRYTQLGVDNMEQTILVDEYNDELFHRHNEQGEQYEFLKRQAKE